MSQLSFVIIIREEQGMRRIGSSLCREDKCVAPRETRRLAEKTTRRSAEAEQRGNQKARVYITERNER